MISQMGIANAVLAPLVALGCALMVMQDLGDFFGTLGGLTGIVVWSAPFYLAWRGLGPKSTMGMVRKARLANIIVGGLIVLLPIGLIVAFWDKHTSFGELSLFLLIMLVYAAPFALNIKALAQRKAELDQMNAEQATEHRETQATPDIAAAMTSTASSAPPSPSLTSSNYFVRHWRGELSLGISYWLTGNLATIATLAVIAAVNLMEEGTYSLRAISFASIGVLLFSVAATVWSIVGIWRSASHHVARGGSSGWANAARVMVVLGSLVGAGQLAANILPQLKEHALIAIGNDPVGNIEIKVATNGQSVIVHGMLRAGSAEEIQRILDAAPGAHLLVLNAGGGRLLEAQRLARAVRTRTLDTYVEDLCVSACTYVFLAGKDRAATPNARIGFHQPSFPGLDADNQRSSTEDMLQVYRTAGLPELFIQRIGKIPSESMWYPTRDELIAAHVITRTSLGGEASTIGLGVRSKEEFLLKLGSIPLYEAIQNRFPDVFQEVVDRGWAARERGGSDADIMNAMRIVVSGMYPRLLKTVDVSTLDRFIALLITEMSAAQAISDEACSELMAAKLDITKTLPKEIVEQERNFLLEALNSPPTTALPPPDQAQVKIATRTAFVNLSQRDINVITDPNAYAGQPALVCEAMIAFYRAINALPQRERHIALRGMFQGED